jgi:hypothetical protein
MESIELQKMVKAIFGDPQTRTEFVANPDIVMSRFYLTEAEKKAVMNTHLKLMVLNDGLGQLDTIGPLSLWI